MSCACVWPPPCVRKESVKPRKSTAILIATWVSTFVVYLFVKPADGTTTEPVTLINSVPSWVNPTQ